MDTKTTPTAAELKLKELELKRQIASEVNPSLKDIKTIKRRISNLKSKVLIQDIDKAIIYENKKELANPDNVDSDDRNVLSDLVKIEEYFNKLESKIQIRLSNL
ncbi:hypothetical protein D9V86_09930 [Bacteroidetes/Chlorobi group bacterium ChocPot_Mid]|nr:MAG: hypothetical protein D9V86_09930 [Bacteroidetes/Chlorobi group bacterium ChocPot_Mid]